MFKVNRVYVTNVQKETVIRQPVVFSPFFLQIHNLIIIFFLSKLLKQKQPSCDTKKTRKTLVGWFFAKEIIIHNTVCSLNK
jgi:hypothetical protein